MGIKLDVSVETPLSDDDRDILAGISVMVPAIANRHNLSDQPQLQDEVPGEPMPRGSQSRDDPTLYCIKEIGHPGRHTYRPVNGMLNQATPGGGGRCRGAGASPAPQSGVATA